MYISFSFSPGNFTATIMLHSQSWDKSPLRKHHRHGRYKRLKGTAKPQSAQTSLDSDIPMHNRCQRIGFYGNQKIMKNKYTVLRLRLRLLNAFTLRTTTLNVNEYNELLIICHHKYRPMGIFQRAKCN